MLAPAYFATFIPIEIDGERAEALAFVADPDAELIACDMTREEQIACLIAGTGFFGTSLDYLANVVSHLHEMNIPDPDLDDLLAETKARMDAAKG